MKVWRIRHDESGLFHRGSSWFHKYNLNKRGQIYTRIGDVKSICTRSTHGCLPDGYSVIEYELGEGKEIEL